MERRIEEANGDRQSCHGLEDLLEVGLLQREKFTDGLCSLFFRSGQYHFPDNRKSVHGIEHPFGSTEADSLCPQLSCLRGIFGRIRIGPNAHGPYFVRPLQEGEEMIANFRINGGNLSLENLTS